MLHGSARRGSGTRPRLLPRAVLMDICPSVTPSSAQVTAKPESTLRYAPQETIVIAYGPWGDSPPQTGLGPEIIPFSGFLALEMAAAGVKVTLFVVKIRS